jgi:hypothetical protein
VLAGIIGLVVYFLLLIQSASTATVKSGPIPIPVPNPLLASTDPFTVLVLGSDDDAKFPQDRVNTQSMILIRVDPAPRNATMLSIPRNLWVPIAGQGMCKISPARRPGRLTPGASARPVPAFLAQRALDGAGPLDQLFRQHALDSRDQRAAAAAAPIGDHAGHDHDDARDHRGRDGLCTASGHHGLHLSFDYVKGSIHHAPSGLHLTLELIRHSAHRFFSF